jgi:diaminohydroxyphosphoribosylaminopyrimidine deaminase/5-amino-6-(5-phosphoribosylamino)uracil reductase
VVLDSRLRTPPGARILAPPGTALILCSEAEPGRAAALREAGAEVLAVGSSAGGVDLAAALAALAARQVNELLVECGAGLAGALLSAGLADELLLYLAPTLLGRGARPLAELETPASLAGRLQFSIVESQDVGGDLLLRLRPRG